MKTVAQAFHEFLEGLELTESDRKKASEQQNVVRDNLREHLGGLDRDFLSGSYSRGTAIRPLNDIDLFVVLNKQTHLDIHPPAVPANALRKVQQALAKAYPNKQAAKLQGRSVNIQFAGTGIGYDVVPAFLVSDGSYLIPDRERETWIRTDPEKHKQACADANRRVGSKLNKLIKAAKHYNQHNGALLRSFHLEVMAYSAFSSEPPSYASGFQALLAYLGEAVTRSCPDPAGIGPKIDGKMTSQERARIQAAFRQAAAQAKQAIDFEQQKRTDEAHGIWRRLLGPSYPERGK